MSLSRAVEQQVARLCGAIPEPSLVAIFTRWADRLAVAAAGKESAHLVLRQQIHRGEHREFRVDLDERV